MSRASLVALLRERLGLDPGSLGERVLDQAFEEARRNLGLADDAALLARVLLDPLAFRELVARIVVPETWFFRAAEQFADLARFALGEARARRPLRVLSLPCASGEEAWSAAITLLDAGLAPGDFEVLGIDVAPALVARAERGEYLLQALRGREAVPVWLEREGDRLTVAGAARRGVRFRVGNVLDPLLFGSGERFDVVFCRNLLIYLTAEARQRTLAAIATVLEPPALVLAGQAEVLPTMAPGFVPLAHGSPLSYRYAPAVEYAALAPPPAVVALTPRLRQRAAPVAAASSAAAPASAPAATPSADDPLAEAQRLADRGELELARKACLERLAREAQDRAALYLLGLVESGRGDLVAAETAFARVLYLDPHHVEALEHRAACAERLGRPLEASQLRARAARQRKSGGPS
jgi:chemotaxis protein methyltransferase WspC